MKKAIPAICVLLLTSAASGEHSMMRELSVAEKARLILPEDLVYQGAFRFPKTPGQASRWGYGGRALTYYPGGDPDGPDDDYPGSLFGA